MSVGQRGARWHHIIQRIHTENEQQQKHHGHMQLEWRRRGAWRERKRPKGGQKNESNPESIEEKKEGRKGGRWNAHPTDPLLLLPLLIAVVLLLPPLLMVVVVVVVEAVHISFHIQCEYVCVCGRSSKKGVDERGG